MERNRQLKKMLIFALVMQLVMVGCSSLTELEKQKCTTKYPLVLVHGFAYRDDIRLKRYWNSIPETLETHGARVFLSNQNAFGTHEANARQLKSRILDILIAEDVEKVNLIAHSKGGIEARYMISMLDMDRQVASLTTIATPHRGAVLTNLIFEQVLKYHLLKPVHHTARGLARLLGDEHPDPLNGGLQLTPEYMKDFNRRVKDSPQVYYQSYCGVISREHPSLVQRIKYDPLLQRAGIHDGTVSVMSARWGRFRGIVTSEDGYGVSHFEIIGQTNYSDFDAGRFYVNLVHDLKQRGF